MQALALDPLAAETTQGPELVTTPPVAPSGPEQLRLLRALLEIVRDRVESIHSGQRLVTAELKAIRDNLPAQRKPLSQRTQEIHVRATWFRRNGYCPLCAEVPVCTETERLPNSEYDHFFSRSQNRVTQTWLVCSACNKGMIDSEFKAAARSAFESYQQALRPFLSNRQTPLGFTTSSAV
jgi:hypothetical protein